MTQYERGLLYLCSFSMVADYAVEKFSEPSAFNGVMAWSAFAFGLFLFVKSLYHLGKAVIE